MLFCFSYWNFHQELDIVHQNYMRWRKIRSFASVVIICIYFGEYLDSCNIKSCDSCKRMRDIVKNDSELSCHIFKTCGNFINFQNQCCLVSEIWKWLSPIPSLEFKGRKTYLKNICEKYFIERCQKCKEIKNCSILEN